MKEALLGIDFKGSGIKPQSYYLLFGLMYLLNIAPRLRIEGELPKTGPAIITINHLSYLDPPILYFAAARLAQRTIRMVAKDTLLDPNLLEDMEELKRTNKKPTPRILRHVLAYFTNQGNPIGVNRSNPSLSFLRECDKTLNSRGILAIALQETRNPQDDLLAVKEGAAFIALRHPDVPIYPTGIFGSEIDLAHIRRPINYRIGESFTPESFGLTKRNHESVAELTREITRRTALLIPDYLKRSYLASQESKSVSG